MNRKLINIVYLLLVFIAMSCILLFFFTWNFSFTINNKLQGSPLEHFVVDSCEINKSKIAISGWAFIPNQDHSVTKLYAENQQGQLLPIASNSVVREDVSKVFGKIMTNRNPGFQASKRLIYKENLTNKIFLVTKTEKNQYYVAQYICK